MLVIKNQLVYTCTENLPYIMYLSNSQNFPREVDENIFCVCMSAETLCLVCNGTVAVLKGYEITKHYSSKYKEVRKPVVIAQRREKNGSIENGACYNIMRFKNGGFE